MCPLASPPSGLRAQSRADGMRGLLERISGPWASEKARRLSFASRAVADPPQPWPVVPGSGLLLGPEESGVADPCPASGSAP